MTIIGSHSKFMTTSLALRPCNNVPQFIKYTYACGKGKVGKYKAITTKETSLIGVYGFINMYHIVDLH